MVHSGRLQVKLGGHDEIHSEGHMHDVSGADIKRAVNGEKCGLVSTELTKAWTRLIVTTEGHGGGFFLDVVSLAPMEVCMELVQFC